MKLLIFIFVLCALGNTVFGSSYQNTYWIQFSDKLNSPYVLSEPEAYLSERAIERRRRQGIAIDSSDFPVNKTYVDSIKQLGFNVIHTSRWMNGAIASLDESLTIDSIIQPSFVNFIQLTKSSALKSASNKLEDDSTSMAYYGSAYRQINMLKGDALHKVSKGEGVHIAVIDAGFLKADQMVAFDSLYARNGILGTYDFVKPGNNVFEEHSHGTAVLSIMAGNLPGKLIGAAPHASYWLLRSEDAPSEFPVEEDYWIVAAEFADSVGCDVINTSLGYSVFDVPDMNHSYQQYDGKTLRISKAANLAVQKGMVVVSSAGNSGNDEWGHITAPAEAEHVLAVGAVNSQGDTVHFSSPGFDTENALPKPDISAMGAGVAYASPYSEEIVNGNGTSFSSPIIAGMAACMLAAFPEKNSFEIMQTIRELGNLYPQHDLKLGYGLPDFSALFGTNSIASTVEYNKVLYPNPFDQQLFIHFTKEWETLKFFSLSGTKLLQLELSLNSQEISSQSLSDLPKGVYFAILKSKNTSQRFKLIKR
ncbi:S8 family serine peptidase [Roseimarinus sediminis]|uniref:S8 family serine peptidase n=1 Tax=Roseimarinus sediminis TaxID=1610899 RepID=UPI003D22556E